MYTFILRAFSNIYNLHEMIIILIYYLQQNIMLKDFGIFIIMKSGLEPMKVRRQKQLLKEYEKCKTPSPTLAELIPAIHALCNLNINYVLCNLVPMELPSCIFTANFKILHDHDYLQEQLHWIGVKDTPDCHLYSIGYS